jgi:DNA repair protein RadD
MPTGTGKSVVIAMFLELAARYAGQRVLVLTHSKELIGQDRGCALELCPELDTGVYSAGLGLADIDSQFIFAGIASVHRRAAEFGEVNVIIIDECQLVSDKQDTMYGRFIADCRKANKKLKVIGFSATPWRLKSGLLVDGDLFTDVCYDLTGLQKYNELVADGYLAPLVVKETDSEFDVRGVRVRGGEFEPCALNNAINQEKITDAAVGEMVARAADRQHWLLFGCGIDHAESIAGALCERGIDASFVHSKLREGERDERIAAFRAGELRALVNNTMLGTGFDYKRIDYLGILHPTRSPGRWVQMLGRGTRVHPEKVDCLVDDFAGNSKRLGQINNVVLPSWSGRRGKGTGEGTAPVKVCEHCRTINHAAALVCTQCGAEFPRRSYLSPQASSLAVVATGEPDIQRMKVTRISYRKHHKKGKPDSLKVTYHCGLNRFSEWICFEHNGFALHKAHEWWRARTDAPIPKTVDEAIASTHNLPFTDELDVDFAPKHKKIKRHFLREKRPNTVDSV